MFPLCSLNISFSVSLVYMVLKCSFQIYETQLLFYNLNTTTARIYPFFTVTVNVRICMNLKIYITIVNLLAHGFEYCRRSHGLRPQKATFLAF